MQGFLARSSVSVTLCVALWLSASLSGCGRTANGFGEDDGGTSADAAPLTSCRPSCAAICQAIGRCGAPQDPPCEIRCSMDEPQPDVLCIKQAICDKRDACSTLQGCLADPKLADLTVSGFRTNGGKNQLGYQATVCNAGNATSVPTTLQFYRDRQGQPSLGERGDAQHELPALAPNACKQVEGQLTNLVAGRYRSYAQADAENRVFELHEINNIAGPAFAQVTGDDPPKLPDLRFESFSARAINGNAVDVEYRLRVCNRGAATTGRDVQIGLYFNRRSAPTPYDHVDRVLSAPPLAAGHCRDIVSGQSLGAGSHQSWAMVDFAQQIAESNENNNVAGPRTITIGGQLPDLRLFSLSSQLDAAGRLNYAVRVCNSSNTPFGGRVLIGYYFDRPSAPTVGTPPDETTSFTSLAAGACRNTGHAVSLPPGSYRSWAYIDYANTLAESNESNNLGGPHLVVVPGNTLPDLTVANLSAKYDPVADRVFYNGLICNRGAAPTNSSIAQIYINRMTPPNPGDPGDAITLSVPPLSPGTCTALQAERTLPAGDYVSWLLADSAGAISESNEANNSQPTKFHIAAQGPDLTIKAFDVVQNPAGGVFYSATACNIGSQPTPTSSIEIYHNRSTAPSTGNGDLSLPIKALAAGACEQAGGFSNLQNGSYTAWAFIDGTDQIKESQESNNIVGPKSFVVGGAVRCNTICKALVSPCNMLPPDQLSACVAVCATQTESALTCAENAIKNNRCNDVIQCIFGP